MPNERAYLEAMAHQQGGFTEAQWHRLCELENRRMEPIIAEARRRMEMIWFQFNERHFLFAEGAD